MCCVLFDIYHQDLLSIKQNDLVTSDWRSTLILTNLSDADNFYCCLVLFTARTSFILCKGPDPCIGEESSNILRRASCQDHQKTTYEIQNHYKRKKTNTQTKRTGKQKKKNSGTYVSFHTSAYVFLFILHIFFPLHSKMKVNFEVYFCDFKSMASDCQFFLLVN